MAEHADSHHYIVNHELYQQLAHQELLQSYAQRGIEILDGEYSNSDLHEHAQNALNHIHHAADSGGIHIPTIGLLLYGRKSAENVRQFFNRDQTANELAANLIGDGGARTGVGFVGWHMGASIGTMIAPGIGTVIGAGIAGLIASLSAGSFFSMLKERWKYGDIIEAQSRIGERYLKRFPPEALEQWRDHVYRVPEIQRALRMESHLLDDYRDQLNPYKADSPSLAAVLCSEYVRHLEARYRQAQGAATVVGDKILQLYRLAAAQGKQDLD